MRSLTALLVLLLLPLAAAQGHEHGEAGPIAITTDLGPAMQADVGSPVHFALLALGDDLEPDFHQDIPVRVSLGEHVLWETTAVSGHDYDGINVLDVVFPAAGAWEVAALAADGSVAHAIHGTAVDRPLRNATLEVVWPTQARTGETVAFQYELVDGGRVNHTDGLFELYKDGELWFRTQTHTHTEVQRLEYVFTEPGAYTVRIAGFTAFPSKSASVTPDVFEASITVATGEPAPMAVPSTKAPADKNAVVRGTSDAPYQLIGTYDPFTIVGPRTIQHLNAIVMDPMTRMPVQHVDFEATLTGPNGVVFSSDTLHEYDGIFELATRSPALGEYVLSITAERGDWSGEMSMAYTVAPPVQATIFGPQTVSLSGISVPAGQVGDYAFYVGGLGDRPFAHGEIELAIRNTDGDTLLRNKLHTHGDGMFPFRTTLAAQGDYPLSITPFPLDPQPVTGYAGLDQHLFAVAGSGIHSTVMLPAEVGHSNGLGIPGPWIGLVLVGLAVLARRR